MNKQKIYSILSWNVDSYKEKAHQILTALIEKNNIDIIFLSETKKPYQDLADKFNTLIKYNYIINVHNPYRYHGVVFLIKKGINYQVHNVTLPIESRSDNKSDDPCSGRIIMLEIENQCYIIGSYIPNSGISINDYNKFEYRLKWDTVFSSFLNTQKLIKPTMWLGDINVALDDIDVSSPNSMVKYAGFRPKERENFRTFLTTGWIDVWRYYNPTKKIYTWIGYNRRPNYGLRLDNIVVSNNMFHMIQQPFILTDLVHSDHLPIGVWLVLN